MIAFDACFRRLDTGLAFPAGVLAGDSTAGLPVAVSARVGEEGKTNPDRWVCVATVRCDRETKERTRTAVDSQAIDPPGIALMNLFRSTTIKTRLILLTGLALAALLGTVGFCLLKFAHFNGLVESDLRTLDGGTAVMLDVAAANVDFKTQVQEWKTS